MASDEMGGESHEHSTSEEAPQVSFNDATGRIRILPEENDGGTLARHSSPLVSSAQNGESLEDELPVRSIPSANAEAWEPASDAFSPDLSAWTLGPREEVTATLFATPPTENGFANEADEAK
ncbi:MAG: hypothetical protein GY822_09595 [Deltaproteobacteria bacterium]|nr:hypothetical protein [Deltaproteobacteria bacterium]